MRTVGRWEVGQVHRFWLLGPAGYAIREHDLCALHRCLVCELLDLAIKSASESQPQEQELDGGGTHNTQEPLAPGTDERLKSKASRQHKRG